MATLRTYEDISSLLEQLERPKQATLINIDWLAFGVTAVGRDGDDSNLVLIVGSKLTATSSVVARAMRFAMWVTTEETTLEGNVIALPAGDHFRAATATIAVELMRHGIDSRPPGEVLQEVEPLIELVIRRLLLPPECVLGLIGELYVLDLILRGLGRASSLRDDPTAIWRGHLEQSRDFALGPSSIEVKTTATGVARHHFSGFSQVEPTQADGAVREALYLVSIGLQLADTDTGLSVAQLCDSILTHLDPQWSGDAPLSEVQKKFVDRLAEYGPRDCIGYRHPGMSDLEPYRRGYVTSYAPRLYDMSDPNVRILRRADLIDTWLLESGFEFTAELPEHVPGSIDNPSFDLPASIRKIVSGLGQ